LLCCPTLCFHCIFVTSVCLKFLVIVPSHLIVFLFSVLRRHKHALCERLIFHFNLLPLTWIHYILDTMLSVLCLIHLRRDQSNVTVHVTQFLPHIAQTDTFLFKNVNTLLWRQWALLELTLCGWESQFVGGLYYNGTIKCCAIVVC
jgi:hypothetical protein